MGRDSTVTGSSAVSLSTPVLKSVRNPCFFFPFLLSVFLHLLPIVLISYPLEPLTRTTREIRLSACIGAPGVAHGSRRHAKLREKETDAKEGERTDILRILPLYLLVPGGTEWLKWPEWLG